MMFKEFVEIVLDPTFLAMFGLVLLPFLPLLLSIWKTWQENGEKLDLE
ncbi:MAG: hypothetical protein GYB66_03430 [Chloroflexi bacterium]|nr:hypothetical protein [Chloroflexota bacterium]